MSPRTYAVLLGVPRCGSTLLRAMLEQHPDVTLHGELLRRLLQKRARGRGPLARGLDPVDATLTRLDRAGTPVAGLQVLPADLTAIQQDAASFAARLAAERPASFVVLRRRNLLRALVSSAACFHAVRWDVHPDVMPAGRVPLDPERMRVGRLSGSLLELLAGHERAYDELERAVAPHRSLRLVYEDDVAPDPRGAFERICHFLEIEPVSVEPPAGPSGPWRLGDVLLDPAAVETALAGTRYAWMLDR